MARERAAAALSALDAVRSAPFRCNGLCHALEAIEYDEELLHGAYPSPPPVTATLIHRFARAMARAQEEDSARGRLKAFAAAVLDDDATALPNRFRIHARHTVPYEPTLEAFAARHAEVLDAEILGAPNLGEMVKMLRARSRRATDGYDDHSREHSSREEEARLRAGALLVALLFDFYAVWQPQRERPLLRKDFAAAGPANGAWQCSSVVQRAVKGHGCKGSGAPIAIGWEDHVPIVRKIFYICSEASLSTQGSGGRGARCELP